jgi:lipid-binding SYLF domain-containing protein
MSTPDRGIPELLNGAKCIVAVPNLLKDGFIFGGKHGHGTGSSRTPEGWSAPAFVSTGGSWGVQIGVKGVNLIMPVSTKSAGS